MFVYRLSLLGASLKSKPDVFNQLGIRCFSTRYSVSFAQQNNDGFSRKEPGKLMYIGKLTNRILPLKFFSSCTSVTLAVFYGMLLKSHSLTSSTIGTGILFAPFLSTPFLIGWFYKRYVVQLYYNPSDDTYSVVHYGMLFSKKTLTFKRDDVIRTEADSVLNTFKVGNKPFFIHEEDLTGVEAVKLYKRMMNMESSKDLRAKGSNYI